MTTLSNDKLAWFDLDASIFPKAVQDTMNKAAEARKAAAIATKAADDMLQTFASRIQVPYVSATETVDGKTVEIVSQRKLLAPGESMVISHRFGKLSVAATTTEKKKAKAEKSASLA